MVSVKNLIFSRGHSDSAENKLIFLINMSLIEKQICIISFHKMTW